MRSTLVILLNTKLVFINHTWPEWIGPSWLTSLRLPTGGSSRAVIPIIKIHILPCTLPGTIVLFRARKIDL